MPCFLQKCFSTMCQANSAWQAVEQCCSGLHFQFIAAVIPPLIILGIVSAFYTAFISNTVVAAVLKGMEAGVAALMVDLIIDMCCVIWKKRSVFLSAMIPAAFFANFVLHINVALILAVCCLLCIVKVFWEKRGENE